MCTSTSRVGVRVDEPGIDLAIALAIASAARGAPVREGFAAFGEIGLTGRLRGASQMERRLEECERFGVTTALAPEGTTTRGGKVGPTLVVADTLRRALVIGLEPRRTVAASGDMAP